MKYSFIACFLLVATTAAYAQKKAAQKPVSTASATQKQPATASAKSTAVATPAAYVVSGTPEEFKKFAAEARTDFEANKLDDSRFALQQMLAGLDMIIGKEVLKALPATLQDKPAVAKMDNVSGASGFVGVVIHREYGKDYSSTSEGNRNITIEIISNSPLIAGINSLLSIPLIGNSGDNKVVKISGYKALITKSSGSNNEPQYDLQLPLGSSLVTVKAPGSTQEQMAQIGSALPVQEIAKMLQ